jgi:hypothetical protein
VLFQIGDHDIGTFASESQRDRTTNAAIRPGNQRGLAR